MVQRSRFSGARTRSSGNLPKNTNKRCTLLKNTAVDLRRGNNTVERLAAAYREIEILSSQIPALQHFHSLNANPMLEQDNVTVLNILISDDDAHIHNSSITTCPSTRCSDASFAGAMAFRMAANRLAARVIWPLIMGTAPL